MERIGLASNMGTRKGLICPQHRVNGAQRRLVGLQVEEKGRNGKIRDFIAKGEDPRIPYGPYLRKCQKCGAEYLPQNFKYCLKCGAELE